MTRRKSAWGIPREQGESTVSTHRGGRPELPADRLVQRLPEQDDGPGKIIRHCRRGLGFWLCAFAGSQAAHMALPSLRQPGSCRHTGTWLSRAWATIGALLATRLFHLSLCRPKAGRGDDGTLTCGMDQFQQPTVAIIPSFHAIACTGGKKRGVGWCWDEGLGPHARF